MEDVESRAERLARLEAETAALEAEAAAVVTPEDVAEHAALERLAAARRRKEDAVRAKQRADLIMQTERLRKSANGAYVVEPLDMEETAPGAGVYVIRSPSRDVLKKFRDACDAANGDNDKIDRAYVNLAGHVILWPESPSSEAWVAHREKYPSLAMSIGDAAGRLGGVAATARKR